MARPKSVLKLIASHETYSKTIKILDRDANCLVKIFNVDSIVAVRVKDYPYEYLVSCYDKDNIVLAVINVSVIYTAGSWESRLKTRVED